MNERALLMVCFAGATSLLSLGCDRKTSALEATARGSFAHYEGSSDAFEVVKCRIEKLPLTEVREYRMRYLFAPDEPPQLGVCTLRFSFHDWPARGRSAPRENELRFVWVENADRWELWPYEPH